MPFASAAIQHGTARLYTLITVVTPAKPTRPGSFGSRLPGPFAAVRATGSHLPRLSEALATGTRPVRSLFGMRLSYGEYMAGAGSGQWLCVGVPPWIKSIKSPKVGRSAAHDGRVDVVDGTVGPAEGVLCGSGADVAVVLELFESVVKIEV